MSVQTGRSLCAVCLRCLFLDDYNDLPYLATLEPIHHHPTLSSLRSSAEANCSMCKPFWNQIQQIGLDLTTRQDSSKVLTIMILFRHPKNEQTAGPYGFSVYLSVTEVGSETGAEENERGILQRNFVLEPIKDVLTSTQRTETHHSSSCYTNSNTHTTKLHYDCTTADALPLAKAWVDTCVSNHHECKISPSSWRPTRLLDVSGSVIRLVLGAELPSDVKYMTLSHCWGDASFLKLSKDTYQNFRNGVASKDLALTVQQSIIVTRFFEVKYLWIDALCILQDDDDQCDWMQEALSMHKVYSGSFLNLSASAARDSRNGLFYKSDGGVAINNSVTLPFHGHWNREIRTKYMVMDEGLVVHDFGRAPIQKRGWVFQERLLAPRVLHFCSNQLFWECKSEFLCEAYPVEVPFQMQNPTTVLKKNFQPTHMKDNNHESRHKSQIRVWDMVLMVYTRCHLTYLTDKLFALSGIVKLVETLFEEEYVAGFWRNSLHERLGWRIDHFGYFTDRYFSKPSVYRAPSWSWLSLDGRVTLHAPVRRETTFLSEVKDIKIEYVTLDNTGPIKSGLLYLCCPLYQVMAKLDQNTCYLYLRTSCRECRFVPDVSRSDLEELSKKGELYMAHLYNYLPTDNSGNFITLLVLRCVDNTCGTYERLGVADVSDVSDCTDEESTFAEDLRRAGQDNNLPCHSFDAETGLHTIIIR